ncbi:WD40 repeat-like protein [Piromyces finnis]|uniref:WD40 repeat-like protein n=1 Tax=Piromyces finnis TaxID=1754191 RepID=A0A1Y1VNC2_9FUNG|nr:WD40 repeat-like protein [Piromyces finnis]|eukprot:ORX60121.1 WD40 repeat-like protein [Piromyces finnis]
MDNTNKRSNLVVHNNSEIIKLILSFDKNERNEVYKELIKYCGSEDRKFIKNEIKQYRHKDVISLLPEELSLYILSLLDFRTLIIASMVNKKWNILCSNSELWKQHCHLFSYQLELEYNYFLKNNNYQNIFKMIYCRESNYKKKKFNKHSLNFHNGKIMGVYVSSNNQQLISLSFDRTIQIHDINTFKLIRQFETDTMKCSSLYNNELLVIGTFSRTCVLYNIKTDDPPKIFTGHINTVCAVNINNQYMISASLNKYIFVWDWKEEKRIKELKIPDEYYYNRNEQDDNALFINFSVTELKIKDQFIIAAIHNHILVWNIEKDFELYKIITLTDTIRSFDVCDTYIFASQIQSYSIIPILEEIEEDIIVYKNRSLNVIQKIVVDEKRIVFWYIETSQSSSGINPNRSFIKIINREDHKELFKCESPGINVLNINKNSIVYGDYYGSIIIYDFS